MQKKKTPLALILTIAALANFWKELIQPAFMLAYLEPNITCATGLQVFFCKMFKYNTIL